MSFVLSGIAFLVLLTLLVIVHELGHYLAAKWSKVNVEEFGFGIPPRVKRLFTYRGTLFSLNAIPFGGFVRLQGENSLDPDERDNPGSFAAAPIPARLFILVAGVCMNVLVAFCIFTVGFWLYQWVPTYLTYEDLQGGDTRGEVEVSWGVVVKEVLPESPAAAARVEPGGVIVAVDGTSVTTVEEILAIQEGKASVTYMLKYPSDESPLEEVEAVTKSVTLQDGKAGIVLAPFAASIEGVNHSFLEGAIIALRETTTVTVGTIRGVGVLVRSLTLEQKVPDDIADIVGIAELTHPSLQQGLMKYLRLVGLLSLSLAVLNILPFPALDGGRVIFVLYELFARRPMNRRVEVITNGIGIALIMVLMLIVTWNDILRLLAS